MKLLIAYGTRPEYIKIKPLLPELDKANINYTVLYTGQHADIAPTDIANTRFIKIIDDPEKCRLDSIVTSILSSPFIYKGITHVMVQGDTTSAFAVALGAFHRGIPVIHLEAGLRTYMKTPYPEEFNRTAVSKMASIHLAPTKLNKNNLLKEGIPEEEIFITGNTVLDNLVGIATEYGNTIIVTMHRRENFSELKEYFETINSLATTHTSLDFLIPVHPNPRVQELKYIFTASNIKVVKPIPYHEFVVDLARCKFIISDSGGLQEEASFLGKRIIVCRESTERPEALEKHGFLCKRPQDLPLHFTGLMNNYRVEAESPFGDGQSSKRIAEIIRKLDV